MKKKAIVVGGSNGIGLALSNLLIMRGYELVICDRVEPDYDLMEKGDISYSHCDLLNFDEELFSKLAVSEDVEVLLITAGIGRVADFAAHHISEIDSTISIDLMSVLKIIYFFYDRISSTNRFYTGVMASISGRISTPGAAVYAAAKAGVVRFIESVNVELEEKTENRILEVSPGSFKGSRFYGGKNDLSLMIPLASEILDHLFNREILFIPQYEEVFRGVIERYYSDPIEYGRYSYQFKKKSDRFDNGKKVRIGYLPVCETMPVRNLINEAMNAKKKCNYLVVGIDESLNDSESLFELLSSCKYVDKVLYGLSFKDYDIIFNKDEK